MKEKNKSILLYTLKRILIIIPLLFLITSTVFIMLFFAPGDPAILMLGAQASAEKVEELRNNLGLDDPLYLQYWNFITQLVLHGDLGRAYRSNRPVVGEIARTLPVSAQLAFFAMLISSTIAIFLGVISATNQYSFLDNITKIVVLAGVSMPVFWLGLIMISIFSVSLGWFPSAGWVNWRYMILPSLTLAAYPLATIARLARSTMLEVIRQDYIRNALAKGLSWKLVLFRHVLRNAFIPVITVMGVQFGILISGSVLTETIFAIPGIGRLMVEAIYTRDYATIRGIILVASASFALINLLVDITYTFIDPRIRY